jgi:hypothetical protein
MLCYTDILHLPRKLPRRADVLNHSAHSFRSTFRNLHHCFRLRFEIQYSLVIYTKPVYMYLTTTFPTVKLY